MVAYKQRILFVLVQWVYRSVLIIKTHHPFIWNYIHRFFARRTRTITKQWWTQCKKYFIKYTSHLANLSIQDVFHRHEVWPFIGNQNAPIQNLVPKLDAHDLCLYFALHFKGWIQHSGIVFWKRCKLLKRNHAVPSTSTAAHVSHFVHQTRCMRRGFEASSVNYAKRSRDVVDQWRIGGAVRDHVVQFMLLARCLCANEKEYKVKMCLEKNKQNI